MEATGNKKKNNDLKRLLLNYIAPVSLIIIFFAQPNIASATGRVIAANVFLVGMLLALAGAVLVLVRRWMKELGFGIREYRISAICLMVIFLLLAVFMFLFYKEETDIKVYDFSNYWIMLLELRETVKHSLPQALVAVINSLSHDYTYVPVIFLVPLSYLFGTGYFGYVLSITALYLIPACFLLVMFALRTIKVARGSNPDAATLVVGMIIGVLLPGVLWPVFNGYLDVAGLILVALMLNVTLRWDGTVISWKHILALAALSLTLLVTRRWYAYYIVGFYVALGLGALLTMLAAGTFSVRKIMNVMINLVAIAGLCIVLIVLLNREMINTFLAGDYSTAYAAYKTMTWWQNLWQIMKSFGVLSIVLAGAGFLALWKNGAAKIVCIRLIIASVTAFTLFSTVQNLDIHHYYLLTPALLIFLFAAGDAAVRFMKNVKAVALLVCVLTVSAANFVLAFVPAAEEFYYSTQPFSTMLKQYPKQNEYYDSIKAVTADLSEKTADTSELVYVVGATEQLSTELLRRVNLPEQIDSAPYVVYNHIVDLRDGFPSQLFMADYILLSDPFERSFGTVQQVSYQVYELLTGDPMAAEYYQLEATYQEGRHSLSLYKKIQPADRALVDNLSARLKAEYPDHPVVYSPDYALALFEYDRQLDVTYDYWNHSFTFDHSNEGPSRFGWTDTWQYTKLNFTLETLSTAMTLTVLNEQGELLSLDLDAQVRQEIAADITGSETITVIVTPKKNETAEPTKFSIKLAENSLE